jgi:two-component system, OmpR family, phosphate regulon sensor histidine kinase PhoR
MKPRSNIPLLLFVLFSYILAQLGWWAYLITQLTQTVYAGNPKLDQRVWMVWGEGIVFAMLLFIGFIFTYKAYLKEIILARQQRNFLLSVTHELKTPVASLRLFVETMQSRELNEEQKKMFLANALNDTDRLNSLIENILQSTKLDAGNVPLYRSNVDVSALVGKTIDSLKNSIGKMHQTQLNIEESISAFVDEQAITSIISNLYDNAVKYSPQNSLIKAELKKEGEHFLFSIFDQGPGIKLEEQRKIFTKFYRVQSEETRSTKGTGLGLFIVSNLVEKHHGKITVEDNAMAGTIFKVKIPLK